MEIPKKGLTEKEIFDGLDAYKQDDLDWTTGRAFGYVFDPGADILQFAKKAYNKFLTENAPRFYGVSQPAADGERPGLHAPGPPPR